MEPPPHFNFNLARKQHKQPIESDSLLRGADSKCISAETMLHVGK